MIQKFQEDFDNAPTIQSKQIILDELIKTNPTDDTTLEVISDCKYFLKFLTEEEAIVEDKQINQDIDSQKYQLMLCTNTNYPFIANEYYWVRIDNMSNELMEMWENSMTPQIKDYISSIKPITWVVNDNGMGTLKTKILFSGNLSDYF